MKLIRFHSGVRNLASIMKPTTVQIRSSARMIHENSPGEIVPPPPPPPKEKENDGKILQIDSNNIKNDTDNDGGEDSAINVIVPSTSVVCSEQQKIMKQKTDEFIRKARMVHSKDEIQLATKAMWKYYQEKQISPDEIERRKKMAELVSDMIRRGTRVKALKKHSLIVTGSSHTGCCTNHRSDLDMCMYVPKLDSRQNAENSLQEYDRYDAYDYLREIRRSLTPSLRSEAYVIDAIVPILRFKMSSTGRMNASKASKAMLTECDINFMSVVGVYNSHLIRVYQEWDARFPALLLNVKHLARMYGFNDASNSMLGSYSLTLMVIHFLQAGVRTPILPCLQKLHPQLFSASIDNPPHLLYQRPFPRNPGGSIDVDEDQLNLFELLIAFFNYYDQLDSQRFGVSVRLGGLAEMKHPFTSSAFLVEEPILRNNAARAAKKRRMIAEKIHWGSRISPLRVIEVLQK